jgi:hypothetical protein
MFVAICTAGLLMLPTHVARAQSSRGASAQSSSQGQTQTSPSATPSSAKPNLAGTWKLNKDQSDDPRQKIEEAMGRPSSQGGEQEGGLRRQPGAGRPGRGQGPGGGMAAEFAQLKIDQTDTNVKVTGASGRLLATSQPQDKPQNEDNNTGEQGGMRFEPAAAEWQGSQLVAKNQGFGRGMIMRTYELSPDGKQLFVTTKIENERFGQPVTYKQVYDRGTENSQ